jgi:DNA replication protein DnaC
MIIRPKEFRACGEQFRERIKVSPNETKETCFAAWLAGKTAGPSYCQHHPRTQLVLDPSKSSSEQAYKGFGVSDYSPDLGCYWFEAVLHCATCPGAYALCPPEFLETTFDTFDISTPERSRALARCRDFVAQVNARSCGFMLMVGAPGCGKTRLACNSIRAMAATDSLYVRQGLLTVALRETYHHKDVVRDRDEFETSNGAPQTPLQLVQGVRFLVLDEMGCNPLANDERLLLDELIKHRYDHRKPTILISNLPLDQSKEFLGDAITDRIADATGNRKFLLQFMGGSFRRTAGETYLEGLT